MTRRAIATALYYCTLGWLFIVINNLFVGWANGIFTMVTKGIGLTK